MEISSINVRYAKALFSLAKEKNLVEEVRKDLELISESAKGVPEFYWVIDNPVIKPSEKTEIFRQLFGGKVHPQTMGFLELLVKNKRENQIFGIIRWFIHEYKESKGIETATFVTAVPIDENLRNSVKKLVKERFRKEIELIEQVDPSIIGGYILKVDDLHYDGSIAAGLKKIRRELINRK